ncbi:hypothetical protein GFS60_07534 (plasmid) [Rhodococcus sp. WAY2]|nr:hypothetical protein GFS60_07534 [Rhodococcus sp. WAY2]
MNEDLFLVRTAVWCPHTGELDEALRLGVAMLARAVDLGPCGASPLGPSAILARIHRIERSTQGRWWPSEFGRPRRGKA